MTKPRKSKGPVKSATPQNLKTILLVDDRDDARLTTKWFLSHFGYRIDSVRSAEEALAIFDPTVHGVVVTDNSMPGMTGAEMARVIKLWSPKTPVVMHTGLPPEDTSCVDVLIQRPAHLLTLKEALDQLLLPHPPGPSAGSL
jgi:CheY-like chemotaxis protein